MTWRPVQLSLTFTWCHGPYLQLWWHHWRSIKGGNIFDIWMHTQRFEQTQFSLYNVSSHDFLWDNLLCSILLQYFRNLTMKKKILIHTLRNSFLSTCSLPSTSSILKAMRNPVRGSATATRRQLSELYCSIIEILTWIHLASRAQEQNCLENNSTEQ